MVATRLKPNSRPQELFLGSPADIAIYGGAAGGGKSWAELLEPVRHVHNPHFGAVIFRRTSPQITNEGGLWDEAGKIYPMLGATPRVGDLEWIFPSGACVSFRHLQHESTKYHWQGSQVPLIEFDELTHFSESQFWYLLSRNRSTCGVRPYVRGTCNADAGSWVKRLVAPWVDRKHPLFPTPDGQVLWLVRKDGKYVWGKTRQELVDQFGPTTIPKSVTFIHATVFDNVDLLRINPEYLGSLQAQSTVEQARLLYGDWDILNEGLVYATLGTCVVEAEEWPENLPAFGTGGLDWGWHNPFGGLAGAIDHDDVMHVWWERKESHVTLTDHSKAMPRGDIRWWSDPAGPSEAAELRLAGHDVVPCTHQGSEPLKAGIAAVHARIRTGRLKIHGSLGQLIDEAGKYHYEKQTEKPVDADNHLLSALRYMIVGNDRGKVVQDKPPPPTPEQIEAAAEAERQRQREKSDLWHSIDNDAWWR